MLRRRAPSHRGRLLLLVLLATLLLGVGAGTGVPRARAGWTLGTAGSIPDEALAAASLQTVSRGSLEVWTVPGVGHTQGLAAAPVEWEQRVTGFLDQALR